MKHPAETPSRTPAPEGPSGDDPPRLSLAVAAPRVAACDLERFLASRAAAGLSAQDEVLIAASPALATDPRELERWIAAQSVASTAESSADPDCSGLASSEDSALHFSLHPPETTPMRLWGFAMARARGRHVAVLDARDTLAADWVGAWERAAAGSAGPIVCGPVDPGNLEDCCSWAAYLAEYGRFWGPLSPDDLDEAPGNNIVFPRAALPPASTLERDGFWKTFHLEALRQVSGNGPPKAAAPARATDSAALPSAAQLDESVAAQLCVAPAMRVRVERRYRLGGYLQRRYLHGRCYGGRRLQQPGAPPRALCIGFTPLLPWVRTARVLGRLASGARRRSRMREGREWPRAALGPLVLGEIAWSWGELAGYARGAGTACEELW